MSAEKYPTSQLFLPLLERYRADTSFFGSIRIVTEGQFSDRQLATLSEHAKNAQKTLWEQFQLLIQDLYSFKQQNGKVAEDSLEQQLIINILIAFILLQNPYEAMQEEFIGFLTRLQFKLSPNSSEFQLISQLGAKNTENLTAYLAKQKNYSEFIVNTLQYKKNHPELKLDQELIKQFLTTLKQKIIQQGCSANEFQLFNSGYKVTDEIKTFIALIHRLTTEFPFFDITFLQSMSYEVLKTLIDPSQENLIDVEKETLIFFQKTQVLYSLCESIPDEQMIHHIVEARIKRLCLPQNNNSNYLTIINKYISNATQPADKEFAKKFISHVIQLLLSAGEEQKLLKFLFDCPSQLVDMKAKNDAYQEIAKKMPFNKYMAFLESAFSEKIESDKETHIEYLINMMSFVNSTIHNASDKLSTKSSKKHNSKKRIHLCQTIAKLRETYNAKVGPLSLAERLPIFAVIKPIARWECEKNATRFERNYFAIDKFELPASIGANLALLKGSCAGEYQSFLAEMEKIQEEYKTIKINHQIESKKAAQSRNALEQQLRDGFEHLCLEQLVPKMLSEITANFKKINQSWRNLNKKITALELKINNQVKQLKQENQTRYQALKTGFTDFLSAEKTKIELLKQSVDALRTTIKNISDTVIQANLTAPVNQDGINNALAEVEKSFQAKAQQQTRCIELERAFLQDLNELAVSLENDELTLKERAEKISDLTQTFSKLKTHFDKPNAQIEYSLNLAQTALQQATAVVTEQLQTQIDTIKVSVDKLAKEKTAKEIEKDNRRYARLLPKKIINLNMAQITHIDADITLMLENKHEEAKKLVTDISQPTVWLPINQPVALLQQINQKINTLNSAYQSIDNQVWWTFVVLFIFETIFRDIFKNDFDFLREHEDIREIHQVLGQKKEDLLAKQKDLTEEQNKLANLNTEIDTLSNEINTLKNQVEDLNNEIVLREKIQSELTSQLTTIHAKPKNTSGVIYLSSLPPLAAQHTMFFKEKPIATEDTDKKELVINDVSPQPIVFSPDLNLT